MSARTAACSRFIEVGGVTFYVEYHVASGVAYIDVQVCGGVVEKPEGFCVCFSVPFDCCAAMKPRSVSMVGSTDME